MHKRVIFHQADNFGGSRSVQSTVVDLASYGSYKPAGPAARRYEARSLALANTDGGAHVDPRLKDSYADLTRRNSLGWEYADSEGLHSTFEGNAARASVRQIAFELLETLQTQLSPRGDLVAPHTAGRNDPCPCGSGVKFKNCCGR